MSRDSHLTRIFLQACALPAGDRPAFLQSSCAGDAELRAEVEAMLAADDWAQAGGGTDGLAGLVERAAAGASLPASQPALPSHIGPYRILGLLGEGGMGVVYRAVQTEPVHRDVALKVVRAAVDSASAISRFELERQALALMDHPNVARLYDAGATNDGRPYFVMELVHGTPITEHCKTQGLPPRRRVELFLGVCRGVRHAHRRGVIHRDLKPSNILVTQEEGQVVPKVIDFSIAKALGEPGLGTEFRTRTGQVIGTLEYMSPEQAAGRAGAVDTRSDVYALGVVLYELLTGRLPHDISGQPLHEAVKRILEEPPRSLRTTGQTGAARLDDDLATIVSKCLEKEPDRRYGSAADLVEDLERYMDSRPIRARPPSTMYQVRKLVGRHRALFGSLALAVVLLLAFSVTVSIQLGIQRRETRRAEAEQRKAQRINTFLQEMLAAADPTRLGGKVSIRQVLDQAAQRMETGLKAEPEVAAELHHTLGMAYQSLGLTAQRREHLAKSLALRLELYGEDHPETALAHLDLAQSSEYPTEAETEARRALAIYRANAAMDDAKVAECLSALANSLYQQGKLEESRQAAEESLAILTRLPDASDAIRGQTLVYLGVTLTAIGQRQEGEARLREAVQVLKSVWGDHSVPHLDALSDLALNLGPLVGAEEAIVLNREVLAGRLELLGKDHPTVAVSHNNLALSLAAKYRCLEAQAHEEDALRIWTQSSGDDQNVATAWNNLAYLRKCSGDYAGALQASQSALQIAEQRPKDSALQLPIMYGNRGIIENRLGHYREAEVHLRRWLDGDVQRLGENATDLRGPLHNLGSLLLDQGRLAEAEDPLRRAVGFAKTALEREGRKAEQDENYAIILNTLGRCLAAQGRTREAEEILLKTRPHLLGSPGEVDSRKHELEQTAELYERTGHLEVAALYRSALARLDALTRNTAGLSTGG